MDTTALCQLTIGQLGALIRARRVSPVEATEATLERAEQLHGDYNAFIAIWGDDALQTARQAERDIANGDYRGPLHGVPIALKDIFATRDRIVTNGSKIYANAVADYDATVVERLRAAGAIFIGSLNLYQFACGQVVNPDYGPVRNAWNRDHIAGGSSSGSGTAVAADLCVDLGGNPVPMRPMLRRLTLPFNLSGLPACTIPYGMSPEGLPIGLQIIGKPFHEATVLRVAHAYERSTDWHLRHPHLGADPASGSGDRRRTSRVD